MQHDDDCHQDHLFRNRDRGRRRARHRVAMLEMLLPSAATFIVLGLLIGANIAAAQTGRAVSPAPPRTVLVLISERSDLPAVTSFQRGLREKLSDPDGKIDFFVEYLDFGRFPERTHQAAFVRYLRERYSGRRIDVIVSSSEAALQFLLPHREELFPGVPVVAAGTEPRHADGPKLPPGITAIPIVYDYDRTLALALALQPDAREVVVVHGVAEWDLRRLEEARRSLERLAPRLRYRMLGGVPLPEIENAVRNLPPQSFVLFVSMVRDAERRSLVGQDYAGRLAAVSPVPIYGTFGSHMERGTLGGALTDYAAVGRAASAIVSQVLSGNPSSDTIAVEAMETPLRVNWRAIEKWRIPPHRIPPEVQIVFREPTLWDAHRGTIVAVFAVVLLQAALIAGLLLQLRRRRRAESAFKDSEERFRLAADAAHLGMWGWNPSHDRLWATDNCRALHGLSQAGEITYRTFTDVVHPEDRETVRRTVREALRDRIPFAAEYRVMLPAGDVRWIATRGRGSYRGGLEPTGVLGVAIDVTERKQAEETLRRKQHELEHIARVSTMGEIAASLAHELNQPLTAILTNAQAGLRLFDRPDTDPAEIREILQDVVAEDKRAGEVIRTLRKMLRREKTEPQRMDLSNTVRDVLILINRELVEQHVEVETVLAADSFVLANPTQTEQVLLNLMMNGMDAMRQRPAPERKLRITVSHADGATAQVAVRDSGAGIPGDNLDKVFDAFWTTKTLGMGMGLAVCKSIVDSYGGRIWVEPNNDPGVTFFFTLPLAPEVETA